jgi:hypothetical protein
LAIQHLLRDFLRHWRSHIKARLAGRPIVLLTEDSIADHIRVDAGQFAPDKLTLFAIFRDEIFLCAAFFDHYRRIGVEQFLILDDRSTDGTERFLRAQADCVTLSSPLGFGDGVQWRVPGQGRQSWNRAGLVFKSLIPHHFLAGHWALYADADEFLLLPPGVTSLSQVIDRAEAAQHNAIVGPLIEFFPGHLPAFHDMPTPPASLDQLLAESPLFEPAPLLGVAPDGTVRQLAPTKSEALFARLGIGRQGGLSRLAQKPKSPWEKTPLLKHGPGAVRLGSHGVSVPVAPDILLPMAHFVFTRNALAKVARARRWKSHARHGAKYAHYGKLIARLQASGEGLAGPQSQAFTSVADLVAAGLLRW